MDTNELEQRRQVVEAAKNAATGLEQIVAFFALRRAAKVSHDEIVHEIAKAMHEPVHDISVDPLAMALEANYLCAHEAPDVALAKVLTLISGAAHDLGGSAGTLLRSAVNAFSEQMGAPVQTVSPGEYFIDKGTLVPAASRERPVIAALRREFAQAVSPLPDQAPAIECGVILSGIPQPFMGSLSETPEGGLRMLYPEPGQKPGGGDGTVSMVEQFFDYEDVLSFGVRRTVSVELPRIVHS